MKPIIRRFVCFICDDERPFNIGYKTGVKSAPAALFKRYRRERGLKRQCLTCQNRQKFQRLNTDFGNSARLN
ncbi:hypothetical protein [Thorsellia kenyensis]|uniref:Uncharacterized protein n=1 Tax=Thorsellia kenyensis TaxID=1549888 RepID=A0ABV6C7X2_9GAMM